MHLLGTDLDLSWLRSNLWKESNNGRVERLVSIFLRECDIVFESLWHRDKHIVEHSENLITMRDIVRDDAYREEVIEVTSMGIGILLA